MATAEMLGKANAQFAPMSAQRLFVIGGVALIVTGMIFGDVLAVFLLHQNADHVGERLTAAVNAVAEGNGVGVAAEFEGVGPLLENRGTKVDAHAHMIAFGYLALLLAVVQPYVRLSERRRKLFANLFLVGATLLPVGVFCIHYVGLRYSPLSAIGWASIVADFGGVLVLVAMAGEALGFAHHTRSRIPLQNLLLQDRSWCSRALLTGGSLLILAGFLHGSWYAGFHLYDAETSDNRTLKYMLDAAGSKQIRAAEEAVGWYGNLQAAKAVNIATHSHIIEFGLMAMLLAFIQPYVMLAEHWRRRWVGVLLTGSVMLPVFVFLELRFGLIAGGIADVGGVLVIVALLGMLTGVIRYTGRLDAGARA